MRCHRQLRRHLQVFMLLVIIGYVGKADDLDNPLADTTTINLGDSHYGDNKKRKVSAPELNEEKQKEGWKEKITSYKTVGDPAGAWLKKQGTGVGYPVVTYENIQSKADMVAPYKMGITGESKRTRTTIEEIESTGKGKGKGKKPATKIIFEEENFNWGVSGEYKIFDIEKIQYKSGKEDNNWTDVPSDGLVVAKGGIITFRAVPTKNPPDGWYGKLQWVSVDSTDKDTAKIKFNDASTTPTNQKEIIVHLGKPDVAKKIQIVVVDLSKLQIKAKRISEPVESEHFVILEDEHFDTGSTFEFKLDLEAELKLDDGTKIEIKWPFPVFMGAEIWDTDGINDLLINQKPLTNEMISYKFNGGNAVDIGNCLTRYYFDDNFSGNSNTEGFLSVLFNNPCVDSKEYWVMERVSHKLTFAVAPPISTLPQSIEEMIKTANELFLKKERHSILHPDSDDYRACIDIAQEGDVKLLDQKHLVINMMPIWHIRIWYEPVPEKATGYYDEWGEAATLQKLGYNCYIVEKIISRSRDKTIIHDIIDAFTVVGKMSIIIATKTSGNYYKYTFAHEFGHGKGIKGDYNGYDDDLYLMYFTFPIDDTFRPLLKKTEAATIDGGK